MAIRNENHYRAQSKLLPIREDINVKDQFGFLPLSIIKPTKQSKEKWNEAYFDDGEIDIRQVNGGYIKSSGGGPQKMSEFHAGVAENIIRYWSLPGAKVVDPFAGRVTRAVVTSRLEREYHGYEITPNTHKRALEHFNKLGISPNLYLDDGTKLSHTADEFSDLILTCPPYYNIERYESVDGQLSDSKTYEEFMGMIDVCATNCYRVARPGSFCVWVVADFRDKALNNERGNLMDFHGDVTQSFKKAGWLYHDIIIMENISPFAALTQYQAACKRYTPKTHEYILVFRKPGDYIVPDYCSENIIEKETKLKQFFE
jgi:DNA modification methylase